MLSTFESFLIPLLAIAAAELGDKTQISILLLSSRTRKHHSLLASIIIAFLIVDGIAILAGSWITQILPVEIIQKASGIIFILFGIYMIINNRKQDEKQNTFHKNIFFSGFLLVFLTEWGDKTQIAAALFATQYNPIITLIATMTALTLLSIVAIYFGKIISKHVDRRIVTKIAGIIFIILGITFLIL